mmetsp:Transcript_32770/g.45495  ORF Transcript_32770/g.45495 Transcript_32770/m.45495 type:complete len:528 (+) Transcript_32770:486-2069(+)
MESHGKGGWASRYRVLLVVWALALVLLSSSMLGDVKPPQQGTPGLVGGMHKLPHQPLPAGASQGAGTQGGRARVKVRFGHKKCFGTNGSCQCEPGYTGPFCEDAVCDQGCVHGKCLRPGYCTCQDGYKGRSCDEPVCLKPCNHGKCTQPDFCKCFDTWYGVYCDQQCEHGSFMFAEQKCACEEGWFGKDCNRALCTTHGCLNGDCVRPDECMCYSGWGAVNCSYDQLTDKAEELLDGLAIRIRKLPAIVVHRNDQYYRDSWRYVRKWTAHLQQQWQFGRTRFTEGLPMNDTLVKYTLQRFETCAAVGNSGGLLRARAGQVIDEHDVVLRFNNAPTKSFEEFTGSKTTFKLLNRKSADSMLEQPTPAAILGSAKKIKHQHSAITLLWRAESYHYYGMLRKKYLDEPVYLLAPELLIPLITLYKTIMKRMEDSGIKWEGSQSAPSGFVGIAYLLQVCQKVDIFGFDVSKPKVPVRYHYFDKTEPTELHSTEFEHNLLRVLHAYGLVRLCTVDTVESCIHDWELQKNRIE